MFHVIGLSIKCVRMGNSVSCRKEKSGFVLECPVPAVGGRSPIPMGIGLRCDPRESLCGVCGYLSSNEGGRC